MKNLSSLKKISFTFVVIVLLPALFYAGYELSSLSTSEELFGKMYQQRSKNAMRMNCENAASE